MIALLKPFQLFTPLECQQLINSVPEVKPGLVWGRKNSSYVRNSSVFFYPLDQVLKDRLWNLALPLRSYYNWTWFQEPVQISRYNPGEFYQWHDDVIPFKTSKRCITLTCTLQAADGAVFEVEDKVFNLCQGQAVFFDSHLKHRAVSPVQGTRWAFTVWYMMPSS